MPFKSLSRKAAPPPLEFAPSSSTRDRTQTGPSTAPYKHYNPSPLTPTSAPALAQQGGSPSSPTSFKFWKRKTSSSSPTDASFPPTPPSHNNTPRHSQNAYASSSSTPLRASYNHSHEDFAPAQARPRQASYGGPPSSSSASSSSSQGHHRAHPSEGYRAPLHQQQQQPASVAPQLTNSSSSRSALFFDEDYDWANGGQGGSHSQAASSAASTYSNNSLPRNHQQPIRPSPPGSYRSLPPTRSTEVPLSAPLPFDRRGSDSPKLYVSTRRTGVPGAQASFGSHSGWGGQQSTVVPARRESAGVPAGKPRMGHGRKRSSSMSNLKTFTSPVLISRPALDDTSMPLRSSSRRGPSPSFRPASSSRPPPSRTTSPFANSPSPMMPAYGTNHHLYGMGPPVVIPPRQLTGLPVVVVVPATPDTGAGEGDDKKSRNSGGWGEATKAPLPPASSVAVDLAKKMEQARPSVAAPTPVSSRPQVPSRALPSVEDARAAILIAEAAQAAPVASVASTEDADLDTPSPRKAAILLPDIDIQELGLSFFDNPAVEPASVETPRAVASQFSLPSSDEETSPVVVQEEDRSTTPVPKVHTRARSGSKPLSSPPRIPLPAKPTEQDLSAAEVEAGQSDEQSPDEGTDALERAGREESHSSMPSLSSSFSVDSSVSASSSEADWNDSPDMDGASESGEGLDEALSQMIHSLSASDSSGSASPFALEEQTKPVYSPPFMTVTPSEDSEPSMLVQQPVSPTASTSLTPKANGNKPLPKSASNSSFMSTSSSILRSPSPTPWHQFPLPPPHTSTSEPALSGLSGLGLGIGESDLLPPRKRQIPAPMLVRDHRRPFYLSASTGCLADKAGNWDETPTAPTAATFAPILVVSPPPAAVPTSAHRSTYSASSASDLINFDSPAMASLSPVMEQKAHLSASSSSSSLASDASGESMFSAEEELGTVSISHVQTTTAVRWAFARSGSGTATQTCQLKDGLEEHGGVEVEADAGWAM